MRAGNSKPVIIVVISVLVAALSYSGFEAFAAPRDPNYVPNEKCMRNLDGTRLTCCWDEPDILNPGEFIRWCQSCDFDGENCGEIHRTSLPTSDITPPQDGVLEQTPSLPTPPPGPRVTPPVGDIAPEAEQPSTPPQPTPRTPGQSVLPGDTGVLEQPPPADQGTPETPATEGNQSRIPTSPPRTGQGAAPSMGEGTIGEPPIPCGVGTVWDPDIMICVPDLPPPELCPDGSIRQPNGECPALPPSIPTEEERAPLEEAEQPQSEEPEESEQESDVQEVQDNEDN